MNETTAEMMARKRAAIDKTHYRRVAHDGGVCICTPDEEAGVVEGLTDYVVTDVYLTRKQWEKLPEFNGW